LFITTVKGVYSNLYEYVFDELQITHVLISRNDPKCSYCRCVCNCRIQTTCYLIYVPLFFYYAPENFTRPAPVFH